MFVYFLIFKLIINLTIFVYIYTIKIGFIEIYFKKKVKD